MAEKKESAEAAVRTIRRVTRKKYSADGEGPDCAGRPARRDQHRRLVPAGRHPD